jgi:hypothetical protein
MMNRLTHWLRRAPWAAALACGATAAGFAA